MPDYITNAQIEAIIPAPVLDDALDDDGDGSRDPGVLDQIIANADGTADGLVCARYAVPFAVPPASIVRAALCFAISAIYARREIPEEKLPPEVKEAATWRKFLAEVGRGERQLDASLAVPLQAQGGGNVYVPGRVPVPDSTGSQNTNY